ncbi:MAG: hypothetical protein E7231_00460 [Cellulosilyticum sp.]|nr:hypothetical protein [Cellulosilyticum sp.]
MVFELPYKTLTPILGNDATYDAHIETTPDFMNGKFKELLENDKATAEQINVLNKIEVIPITYLNGFNNIWGGTRCVRVGNEVNVYLEILKTGASDLSLPITVFKYKPVTVKNILAITYLGTSDNASIVLDLDGSVKIHSWSTANIGDYTIASFKYTTLDAFS